MGGGVNVVRVTASDFGRYEAFEWDVPEGVTAIVGANGAGKSTILAMVTVGLFGERGELGRCLRDGAEQVEVTVEVERGRHVYRVRRGAGKRSYLDFEKRDTVQSTRGELETDDIWLSKTGADQATTQALIDSTLGTTRAVWDATAMMGQGTDSIAALAPADAHALFSEVIGLDRYRALRAKAREEAAAVQRDLDALGGRLDAARAELEGKSDVEAEVERLSSEVLQAEHAVELAQAERDRLADEYAAAHALVAAVDTARAALTVAEGERRRLQGISDHAAAAREQFDTLSPRQQKLQAIAAELPACEQREADLRAEVEGHRLAMAGKWTLEAEQRNLRARANEADNLAANELANPAVPCEQCGRPLNERAEASAQLHRRRAASLRAEADAIEVPDVPDPPLEALKQAEAATQTCRAAERDLAGLDERARSLEAAVALDTPEHAAALHAAVRAKEDAAEALRNAEEYTEGVDVTRIERAGHAMRLNLIDAQQTLNDFTTSKARAEERLARLTTLEATIAAALERDRALRDQAAMLALADKAMGPGGIPALILENRVPAIEETATRILSELGGNTAGARVELRTQRLTKKGDARDTLETVLVTTGGYDRRYGAWSGGEQLRINVALRAALGVGEFFALDEPAFLDEDGKAALLDCIRWLEEHGTRTVLLISHEPGLRDSVEQVLDVSAVSA